MNLPTLYLIPNFLGSTSTDKVFPLFNIEIVKTLNVFVVENEKTARRFLHQLMPDKNLNELEFYVLDKKTSTDEWFEFVQLFNTKQSVGLMSEAGLPAVADPGSDLVKLAHQKDYQVRPLVGPSSIFMALMASGFNGQKFTFHGYIPIDKNEKVKFIRRLESQSIKDNSTQIFMETPYRNNQLLDVLFKSCRLETQLCLASNISTKDEFIKTKTIENWRKEKTDLHKKPTIFLIQS